MTRKRLLLSFCLVVSTALLLPGVQAAAGKGGIPLVVGLDNAGGLRGDGVKIDYTDGDSQPGAITVLRVQLISNSKTLALDTRGAERSLIIDFSSPLAANANAKCPTAGLTQTQLEALGLEFVEATTTIDTEAILEVQLSQPFTSLTAATQGIAKLWFTKGGSDWRVDWPAVTVTPGDPGEWTVTAAVGGLSNLSGKRTKPGTIGREGCYSIAIGMGAAEL